MSGIAGIAGSDPAKGEITLLIGAPEPGEGARFDTAQSLAARVDELMHQAKLDRREALKLAAKETRDNEARRVSAVVGGERAGGVRDSQKLKGES